MQAPSYRVPVSRVPPDAYPLKVLLALSYALSSDGLRVEFLFSNEEAELDAHVSFGLHPGFAVSSVDSCKVLLPPGTYVRYLAPGNFLDGRTEKIEFAGGEMPFEKGKLPDSYLLGLEGVSKPIIVLEDPNLGRRIGFDFSEVPFLTLWSDNPTFVCIEPCWVCRIAIRPSPLRKRSEIRGLRRANHCGVVSRWGRSSCDEIPAQVGRQGDCPRRVHLWLRRPL